MDTGPADSGPLIVFLSTGQSLSLGAPYNVDGGAALEDANVYSMVRHETTSNVPLKQDRDELGAASTPYVEQPAVVAMGQMRLDGTGMPADAALIQCSRSGAPYSELKKGGSGIESGDSVTSCTAVTCTSGVCTVTDTSHGMTTGDYVTITGITTPLATEAAITKINLNSFTVPIAGAADGAMADGTGTVYQMGKIYRCLMNNLADLVSDTAPRQVEVDGVFLNHGEADTYYLHTQAYANYLSTLQDDLTTDIQAATGQSFTPFLLAPIVTSATAYDYEHALMADAIWDSYGSYGTPLLLGPKTYMESAVADSKHLLAAGYQRLGARMGYYAENELFVGPSLFLRPSSASITTNVLTISFDGCTSPLVLDSTTVSTTGLDHHGFAVLEAGGITISSVAVSGCDVQLTGSGNWYAGTKVTYAYSCPAAATACAGNNHGATTGIRGTLRDSTDVTAYAGTNVKNWAIPFGPDKVAVTGGAASPPRENLYSFTFDGTGDELDSADDAAWSCSSQQMTQCAWVKVSSFGGRQLGIMGHSSQNEYEDGMYLGSNGRVFCSVSSSKTQTATNFNASGDSASTTAITCTSAVCTVTAANSYANGDYVTITAITTSLTEPGIISSVSGAGFTVTIPGAANGLMADGVGTALRSTVKPGTWEPLCCEYDLSQGTATNRAKVYKSGSSVTITSNGGTLPSSFLTTGGSSYYVGQFRDGDDGATDSASRRFQGGLDNVSLCCGTKDGTNGSASTVTDPSSWCTTAANLRLDLRMGEGYKTSAGKLTGTPEGYSGTCQVTGGSAHNFFCETAASGAMIPFEGVETGTFYNSAASYTANRFNRGGNPMVSTSHP